MPDEEGRPTSRVRAAIGLVLAALLAVMVAVVSVNVLCRYCLRRPSAWAFEVAQTALVWLCFLGAALGVAEGDHFAVDFLTKKLSPRPARIVWGFVVAAVAVFAALMAIYGAMLLPTIYGQRMPATGLSRAWQYAAVPVSGALMLGFLAARLLRRRRGQARRQGE